MADPSLMPPQQSQVIDPQRPTPGQALAAFGAPPAGVVGPQGHAMLPGAGGYQVQSHHTDNGGNVGTYGGAYGTPLGLGGVGENITQTTDGQWNNGQNKLAGGAASGANTSGVGVDASGYQGDPRLAGTGGGGIAGGQQSYNPGQFDAPDIRDDIYSGGSAFNDPNAGNIYGVINNQINNRANQAAPQLGAAQNFAGTQQANPMMTTGAKLDTGQDLQYAGAQNAQINALAQIASGQGPSVAAVTAQQQRDANIASSMAMLGSQRGASSAGLGLRNAAMGAAQANQAASQQAALGRAQEATAAQAQLTGALSGARGQGQTTAQSQANLSQAADLANQSQFNQAANQQAGLYQQAGLANQAAQNQFSAANQQAQLQQSSLNNASYQSGEAAYMQQNQQDMASNQAYQSMIEQEELQKYGIDKGVAVQQQQMGMQAAGAGISGIAALAMLSDENAKTEIRSGSEKIRDFLRGIGPASGAVALATVGRRR